MCAGTTVESVDRGNGEWKVLKSAVRFPSLAVWSSTVNPFYSRLTLVSPCVAAFTWVKRSLSIVNFERRIASMPGTPAGQPFAAPWLLSCEQRSLPCHVGCMHLPNCHPRHKAFRLDELCYSHAISGRSQFNGCLREEKLYIRGFPLKSTSLQKALLPLLPWLVPFCSLTHTLPPLSHMFSPF